MKKIGWRDWAWVGVVGVLAGVGVWLWREGEDTAAGMPPPHTTESAQLKDGEVVAARMSPAPGAAEAAPPLPSLPEEGVPTKAGVGKVVTNRVASVGRVKVVMADGSEEVRRKPIFSRNQPLERALATGLMPVRSAGASMVAEMERYTDEQLMEWLRQPVVFTGNETEREAAVKLNVQDLKERILEDVANGGNVRDVFHEIDDNACGAAHERRLTKVGLREAVKTGDAELVRAWVAHRNGQLRELGLPEIEVPEEFAEGDEVYDEEAFK